MGKMDRLPAILREQVGYRLRDGQTALKIITWLNSLAEVKSILKSFGWGPMREGNISDFRKGAYREWLDDPAATRASWEREESLATSGQQKKLAEDIIARIGPIIPDQIYKSALENYGYVVRDWRGRRNALLARACELLDILAASVSLRLALRTVAKSFHGIALDDCGHTLAAAPSSLFRHRKQWQTRRHPETFAFHLDNCGRKSREAAQ